jgi:hypothetical protein
MGTSRTNGGEAATCEESPTSKRPPRWRAGEEERARWDPKKNGRWRAERRGRA